MEYIKKIFIVKAIQLNWKNWNKVCDFVGDISNSKRLVEGTNSFSDSCGEPPPYIELTIPSFTGGYTIKHGDYIIKDTNNDFYPYKPKAFKVEYKSI